MRKMAAVIIVLSSAALFAQGVPSKSQSRVPAGLQVIFGNLGKSQTDLYSTQGWTTVAGPGCAGLGPAFAALPFTPKANSHASQLRVPVSYVEGTNAVNLNIYEDAGGVPGALLVGPLTVTNLPGWATCCSLATANFTPVALTGGSQYWIVVNSDTDFCGTWNYVSRPPFPMALWNGTSWSVAEEGVVELAGEVLGTTP
jgi:hypothetical protein